MNPKTKKEYKPWYPLLGISFALFLVVSPFISIVWQMNYREDMTKRSPELKTLRRELLAVEGVRSVKIEMPRRPGYEITFEVHPVKFTEESLADVREAMVRRIDAQLIEKLPYDARGLTVYIHFFTDKKGYKCTAAWKDGEMYWSDWKTYE